LEVLEKAMSVIEHGVKNGNVSAKENMVRAATYPHRKVIWLTSIQEAVRELHRQAKAALSKREMSVDSSPALSADELDRLCGQTSVITSSGRFTFTPVSNRQLAADPYGYGTAQHIPQSSPSPRRGAMSVDNLLNDYTNAVTTHEQVNGVHVPELAWAAGVPTTNNGMALYEVGYQSYAPGIPDTSSTVPLHDAFGAGVGWQGMPYVLDASWQDFVQQLGF
jgi:hypothetical protein